MKTRSWRFRALTAQDAPALQSLMEASGDYYRTCFGAPPCENEATAELAALPPGARGQQKRVLGIEQLEPTSGSGLVGVVDEVADWPRDGTMMLGLLLLRPDIRGAGIGTEVLDELERGWRDDGYQRVRVGIVSGNHGSQRFFERRGFTRVQRIVRDDAPSPYEILAFEREL